MPQFTDKLGRSWPVSLDFVVLRRVKSEALTDLQDAKKFPETWVELIDNEVTAIAVLWVLVQPQAAAQNVSQDDWLAAMNGDTLHTALNALGQAIVEHAPPSKRQALRDVIAEVERGYDKAWAEAAEKIKQAGADFRAS